MGLDIQEDENRDLTRELTAKGVAELIINACVEISNVHYFGIRKTVSVLLGHENKRVIHYGLYELDCFGTLKSMNPKHIYRIINFLIEENFLYVSQGHYPTLRVNNDKSIQEIRNIDLSTVEEIMSLYSMAKTYPIQVVEDGLTIVVDGWQVYVDEDGSLLTDMELLKRLQLLRKKLGDERGGSYHTVATNKVLVQLATKKPTTKEDFIAIKGIRYRWFNRNG